MLTAAPIDPCDQNYPTPPVPVQPSKWPTAISVPTTPGMAKHECEVLTRIVSAIPGARLRNMVSVDRRAGVATVQLSVLLDSLPLDAAAAMCAIADGREIPEAPTPSSALAVGSTIIHRPTHVFVGSVRLTERQKQVLDMLAKGKSNGAISKALKLTEGTVKIHVTAIFKALGVKNRTQAAVAAGHLGLGG